MSSDGSVTLFWGDDDHTFRFAIGQFRELQDKVNARRVAVGASAIGPMALLNQLRANDAWPDDIRDVIRLGLVGGGMKAEEVQRLLRAHFDGSPPLPHMKTAFLVLMAGLMGPPDVQDDAKKKTMAAMDESRSPSASSTAPAPP